MPRGQAGGAMLSLREEHPRSPGTPCPDEERLRQAGLLAHGSAPFRPPSQDFVRPNGMWPIALRLQLQGQPEFQTPFPLNPFSGNLSRRGRYNALQHYASPDACVVARTGISRGRNGCPQGLNREVRSSRKAAIGTAPATVSGERSAIMPLGFPLRRRRKAR